MGKGKREDCTGVFRDQAWKCCLVMSNSLRPLWTVALQAPLTRGLSRQEDWDGLPFPLPGDLPDPGIKPTSPVIPALADGFFTNEPPVKRIPGLEVVSISSALISLDRTQSHDVT